MKYVTVLSIIFFVLSTADARPSLFSGSTPAPAPPPPSSDSIADSNPILKSALQQIMQSSSVEDMLKNAQDPNAPLIQKLGAQLVQYAMKQEQNGQLSPNTINVPQSQYTHIPPRSSSLGQGSSRQIPRQGPRPQQQPGYNSGTGVANNGPRNANSGLNSATSGSSNANGDSSGNLLNNLEQTGMSSLSTTITNGIASSLGLSQDSWMYKLIQTGVNDWTSSAGAKQAAA